MDILISIKYKNKTILFRDILVNSLVLHQNKTYKYQK